MSKSNKIRVMLSSRCNDHFDGKTLSEIRRDLKREIESHKMGSRQVFEVWINEDAPPGDGSTDSWETCLKEATDCDVMIVLANGNAGWAATNSDVGICHAEYMTALHSSRAKVRLVALPRQQAAKGKVGDRDRSFQAYLDKQTAFRGGEVKTTADLKKRVFEALADSVVKLNQLGSTSVAAGRLDMGEALDWSRLDFKSRKKAMEGQLLAAAMGQSKAEEGAGENSALIDVDRRKVAFVVHAIPAAFGTAAARELVGRPFLLDHTRLDLIKDAHGPVHLIACHRSATENQATTLLGFPDATVVSAPFGIYVADDVQKVQFAFLSNCRDPTQTRHAFQRFMEWLSQTGEAEMLSRRAESRANIVKAIAKEFKSAR